MASGTVLGLYLAAASAAHVFCWRDQHGATTSAAQAIDANRVPFAMFLYGLLVWMYPASLWGYHCFLIWRGQTTREYLTSNKFAKQDRHMPFDLKPKWKNFTSVLVRPRPPVSIKMKGGYSTLR